MGVALYIVTDKEEPGFDTFVNGKTIAKEEKRLDAVSKVLGIPRFSDFISMSQDDLEGILGDEAGVTPQDVKWFTPEEGLIFVQAIIGHISANPSSVKNQRGLLDELSEYAEVFERAKRAGVKWHLNIDI